MQRLVAAAGPRPRGRCSGRMTDRPDRPGPLLRRGPRPLLLHLTRAMLKSSGSAPASPSSKPGSPPWSVDAELLAGIAAYRRHP